MYRSRIHEHTVSLRFLGIILRVFRLEVSVWISSTIGRGVWFFILGFPPFSFTEIVRGCVSLKKYKSQSKAVRVTVNSKEENSENFDWISSKNSACGLTAVLYCPPSAAKQVIESKQKLRLGPADPYLLVGSCRLRGIAYIYV
jgi:hypothetical protein